MWHVRFNLYFYADTFQNAQQLFSVKLLLMTKYFVMRECENILSGYLRVVTTVFSQQDGISSVDFLKRCLERYLAEMSLLFFSLVYTKSTCFKASFKIPSESMLLSFCIPTFMWIDAFQEVRYYLNLQSSSSPSPISLCSLQLTACPPFYLKMLIVVLIGNKVALEPVCSALMLPLQSPSPVHVLCMGRPPMHIGIPVICIDKSPYAYRDPHMHTDIR